MFVGERASSPAARCHIGSKPALFSADKPIGPLRTCSPLSRPLGGKYLATIATLSQERRAFAEQMEEMDTKRGRGFAEEVREKARQMGKPIPMKSTGPGKVSI
jgi:hypothetical protein